MIMTQYKDRGYLDPNSCYSIGLAYRLLERMSGRIGKFGCTVV